VWVGGVGGVGGGGVFLEASVSNFRGGEGNFKRGRFHRKCKETAQAGERRGG